MHTRQILDRIYMEFDKKKEREKENFLTYFSTPE